MATECLSHYIYWRPHHRVRCSYGPSWTTKFQWLLVVCRLGWTIIFEWRGKKGSLKIYQASKFCKDLQKLLKIFTFKKTAELSQKAWKSVCRSEQQMPKKKSRATRFPMIFQTPTIGPLNNLMPLTKINSSDDCPSFLVSKVSPLATGCFCYAFLFRCTRSPSAKKRMIFQIIT